MEILCKSYYFQSLCTLPNCSKQSIPHIEVNEWMEHAQQQLGHLQNHPQGLSLSLSLSSVFSLSLSLIFNATASDCSFNCYLCSSSTCANEFVGLPTPTEKEESGSVHEYCYQASEAGSIDAQQHKLMTRPKPYHAFLDEVKKQELEAEIDSWRKAKEMELMDK